jgi:5-methylthioadenosine/S-adenosylhomocysteine deaminase
MSHRHVDLIIEGGTVITVDGKRRIIADGSVAVDGQSIAAVGKRDEIARVFSARRTIDARGDLVMPGLIDAHNHPIHYMTKGATDDLPFEHRMRTIVAPYENGLSDDEAYLNATATFAEMIMNGTTCFNDAGSLPGDGVANAARDVGIRGVVALESVDVTGGVRRTETGRDWSAVAQKADAFVSRWDGAENGRLRAGFTLNNPHRVSDELCRAIKSLADARGVGIHGHMTLREPAAGAPGSPSPLHRYRDLGLLGPRLSLVHLGHVVGDDVALLVDADVKGVHCPGTSTLGGIGVISHGTIPELMAAGMTFGLGSDAATVSRFLDMIRHMYLACAVHKDVRRADVVISCYKALEMATIDGARAILWDDEIGSLEAGRKADIAIVDTTDIALHPDPHRNPVANLVYAGSGRSVRTVIIDGRVVMEDRVLTTVDVADVCRRLGELSPKVLARSGAQVRSLWPVA